MKKVIILGLFMALLTTVQSQVSINLPVGFSTLKTPTVGLNLQAGVGMWKIAAGFDNHISKDKMKGNLIWIRVGAGFTLSELNTLEITAGAGQLRRSTDVKSLNQGLAVVNVQYAHQMERRPEASLFASITGTQKFAIFSGGLRFTFGRQSHGCTGSRIR